MGPDGAQIKIVKHQDTFNLSGKNVKIGQVEPSEPLANHDALNGHVTRHNPGGANSNHATGVADILIGRSFTPAGHLEITGVASGAKLWSSGGVGGAFDAAEAQNIQWVVDKGVKVINFSGGNRVRGNGTNAQALFLDHTVRANDILWAQAVDNTGPGANTIQRPEDAYNAITVGATGAVAGMEPRNPFNTGVSSDLDYTRVAPYSGRGTTIDGRHKPDIVAPGSEILMAGGTANDALYLVAPPDPPATQPSGTSFAAPHVAGMAALLLQRNVEENLGHNHLGIKAALLNSASKHVQAPDQGDPADWYAWPESPAAGNENIPLDDAMGVGQLNGLAAVKQLQPLGSASSGLLVDSTIVVQQEQNGYLLNGGQKLHAGSLVTATLVWDREVKLRPGTDGTDTNHYQITPLANLDLELWNETGQHTEYWSGSTLDNVEHIYFNVPHTGQYTLYVSNNETDRGEDYAIAYTSGTTDGLAFSVDGGRFNKQRIGQDPPPPHLVPNPRTPNPAEGNMAPFTGAFPNDVNALGAAGPGNFPTEGEIFTSGLDRKNMQRLSGALGTLSRVGPHNGPPAAMAILNKEEGAKGVLGLQPNDNIIGLSWGTDGTLNPLTYTPEDSVLLFSVDPNATGLDDTEVAFQAVTSPHSGTRDEIPYPHNVPGGDPGNEAAGDIFVSQRLDPFGSYTTELQAPAASRDNYLYADESLLGLQAPARQATLLDADQGSANIMEDDLDALEMDSVIYGNRLLGRTGVDPDGNGIHEDPIFFNLDQFSPSLNPFGGCMEPSPNDIFVSDPQLGQDQFLIFADGECNIDLMLGDIIDGLILSDEGIRGILDGPDKALFSLDPDSPSVLFGEATPAAVYYTDFTRPFKPTIDWKRGGSLFAWPEQLGLLDSDNLNALDIRRWPVPEPSMIWLLLAGLWLLGRFNRQMNRRG